MTRERERERMQLGWLYYQTQKKRNSEENEAQEVAKKDKARFIVIKRTNQRVDVHPSLECTDCHTSSPCNTHALEPEKHSHTSTTPFISALTLLIALASSAFFDIRS